MPRLDPLPYYKWFWRDWRSNRRVQKMHYIARGFYRELLEEQFIEGSIPDDIGLLAEICGCPRAVMQEYWDEIEPHFEHLEDGSLVHPKMETVRTELDAVRVKASAAGRKSAQARMKLKGDSTSAQPSLTFASDRSTSRAEQSQSRAESEHTHASQPVPVDVAPPSLPPKAATPPLPPLANVDVETLVNQIVCAHPRSLIRKQRFTESTWAQKTAVMDAARDEQEASGCSLIAALEMILGRVELHAREIPQGEYRYLKDIDRGYFRLHEYRQESTELKREENRNGQAGTTKTGGSLDALATARAYTRSRVAPGADSGAAGETRSPPPGAS